MSIIITILLALVLILYYDSVMYERFNRLSTDLNEFKNRTFVDIKKLEESLESIRKKLNNL